MSAEEATLDEKAAEFADTLTDLTRGVLGQDSPRFSALNVGNRIRVAPLAADGRSMRIPIKIDGERCLNLHVQHFCCWDGPNMYLAADRADVHVFFEGVQDPLLRYEYLRHSKTPPGAHLQVHAHRDEMAYLLRLAEKKKGRPAAMMRKGKLPRLSEMHLPVGGHRLRPALEDVLLLLVREFAIDVEDGWESVLDQHLRKWRVLQLKSAVRDAHESAAETLREMGYTVEPPKDMEPQRADSRLYWP
ncbi:hypothetical protein J7E88_08840 [Streptomyces sp. ISL-10]|uniref:hypothetical protein n=1 Tax=Streptomyces sp. ISL-10 TaxID=2819172 RepID=UPI001BEC4238|nr:hypothetical protein [Streptomyces sp. ISL-10]MBT2365422.1 hypothetical protein [Streptomyces sp. ISL-10]